MFKHAQIAIALALVTLVTFNSCKRDILNPSTGHRKTIDAKLQTISYGEFLANVNINTLGFLKSKFTSANPNNKLLSIADDNSFGALGIYTDSVKRIVDNHDTSYVFKMALSSPRAITFRNLTVRRSNGKTSAFIATYTPTKEWIADWRAKHRTPFAGTTTFNEINLAGMSFVQALSGSGSSGSNGKSMSVGSRTMVTETICNEYLVYDVLPIGCSQGNHMPWDMDCPWNRGEGVPYDQYAAYFEYTATNVSYCTTVTTPDPMTGGGGTSPNPPDPYNPCDGDGPIMIEAARNEGGLKLAVVPPVPCDDDNGGLHPIALPPRPDTINHITNPCMNAALALALGKNAKSKVKDLMILTFLKNATVNLDFYSYPFVRPDLLKTDAYTIASSANNKLNQTISLNETLLLTKSKEYQVATIYHEILHAYLANLFPVDQEGKILIPDDHSYILDNYVSMLTADMKSIFPNLTDVEAWALSMGGLQKTSRYALLSSYSKNTIDFVNTEFSNKPTPTNTNPTKGTYCP